MKKYLFIGVALALLCTASTYAGVSFINTERQTIQDFTPDNISLEGCVWGDFVLNYCPTGGSCESTTCGGRTLYKLISCKRGYVKSEGTCLATCEDYPLAYPPSNGCYLVCVGQTGAKNGQTMYKIDSCLDGYGSDLDGDGCFSCAEYTSTVCPSGQNCSQLYCTSGTVTCNSGNIGTAYSSFSRDWRYKIY